MISVISARSVTQAPILESSLSRLYTVQAGLYDELYSQIFNYGHEFHRYCRWLRRYRARHILEVGCGSGRLLQFFVKDGFQIEGLDLSAPLLDIAKTRVDIPLHHQDMRSIKLCKKFDAVLVTGRSFTYMTTNDDVLSALRSLRRLLGKGGILLFDNFYAPLILSGFKPRWRDERKVGDKRFIRESRLKLNLKTGITWDWISVLSVFQKTKLIFTDRDSTTLRAFFPEEISSYLALSGFSVLRHSRKKEARDFLTIARAT